MQQIYFKKLLNNFYKNKINYFIPFVLLISLFSCVWRPHTNNSIIFTFGINPITIDGFRFGNNPHSGTDYLIKIKNDVVTVIDSYDPKILTWTDIQIVYNDPATSEGSFELYVVREWGGLIFSSKPIKVEVYEYTNYPLIVPSGDHGYPLDLEFDHQNTLWVSSEFSKSIYSLSSADNNLVAHIVPQPPELIFIVDIGYGAQPTRISALGEDVTVDSDGNVWFTQGGGYTYQGRKINASRVVKYDLLNDSYSCYNIPANNAQIFGLYIDENIIWVTAAGVSHGNFITSFLPDTFTIEQSSCFYNFRTDFPANFCLPGEINACFTHYDVLKNPAHLIKLPSNNILTSQFFGTGIAEVNPITGSVMEYLLPEASNKLKPSSMLGSGPWNLVLGKQNKLWILEQIDNQIVEFNLNTYITRQEYTIPGCDMVYDSAHTLLPDKDGNLWFSMYSNPKNKGSGLLGRLNSKNKFEIFPSLSFLGIQGGITGLAIHQETGDIYFGEFWTASIGRLHRLD